MATYYVKSSATGANNGTSWVNAFTTLAGAAAVDAAGDVIYVSNNHNETQSSTQTYSFNGSLTNPVHVVCADDGSEPPTTVASNATVNTTTTAAVTILGHVYVEGMTFNVGSGLNNANIILTNAGHFQTYKNCRFIINSTGLASTVLLSVAANDQLTSVVWENCDVKFLRYSQGIQLIQGNLFWKGGSILSGTVALTQGLIKAGSSGRGGVAVISGVDMTNLEASSNLTYNAGMGMLRVVLRNCKLPASWIGSLVGGTIRPVDRVEMHNCDSANTNYRLHVVDYFGSILSETTIVRDGGASDGNTQLAWKMVSSANAVYPHQTLNTPEIVRWNEITGSSVTVAVEVITDNVTLTDAECWLEVQYLGTSSAPIGTFASDAKTNVIVAATNQTASTATWTMTGLSSPVKQKLSVTFTPQQKGFIHAVVKLAKPSTTVYVDPMLTVT